LQLVAEGKVIKEIAAVLNLPPRAVEFHKNNIVAKNGLRTTAELARYAPRHGLVSESS
jgi:DNA-binding NarL/FixJ family response regulator